MPDILDKLEKFMVYSSAEQNEIIGRAQTEIRNGREFVEAHLNEIRRLEALIKGRDEVLPMPIVEPDPRIPSLETAEALPLGNIVKDMTEDEIAAAFGSNQIIGEPTEEEYKEMLVEVNPSETIQDKTETPIVEVKDGQRIATEENQAVTTEGGFKADTFGDNDIGAGHMGKPVSKSTNSRPRKNKARTRQSK